MESDDELVNSKELAHDKENKLSRKKVVKKVLMRMGIIRNHETFLQPSLSVVTNPIYLKKEK